MLAWINPTKLSLARYFQDIKTHKHPSFLFSSWFHRMILLNKTGYSVVVWRKLVHKQPRFGHFHAEFWPFWSVVIMTKKILDPFSSIYFISSFEFHRMILMSQKEHSSVVWRKLVHKQPRFGHFLDLVSSIFFFFSFRFQRMWLIFGRSSCWEATPSLLQLASGWRAKKEKGFNLKLN